VAASVGHHEAQHGLDHDRALRHPQELVAALGWKFGADGAICGVGAAAFVILTSSWVLLTRHATPAASLPATARTGEH